LLARHAGSETEADSGRVLRSIINLAHDLKRSVVVEGVESAEEASWLAQQGCEFGQGFYFSPPLSAAEALSFIARHHDVAAATSP
ncbi:MAG TPA: EAL domain-containing protein, partial [Rhizomicrobium sp.]|nr:EAL domain-containing protein [Rhizomicrobium sp.]